MKDDEVYNEIVIVGAGIAGLATALALQRKGINSVVLERSESLRSTEGTAIGVRPNGWRALDQLGVADTLRQTALPTLWERDLWLDKDKQQVKPMMGENRCVRRRDLINTLADALPRKTIKFGQQIVSVTSNSHTNYPMVQLLDGRSMLMKVLIGCDGANSVVADYLKLKPAKVSGLCALRGLTNYPNGHSFGDEFVRIRKNNIQLGRIPINDKLVYWFVAVHRSTSAESTSTRVPEFIRQLTLELVKDFPHEVQEMIKGSDLESLSFARLRYRTPWDLVTGKFRKGTVTVAGDAMHVMGPFLGQGGAAALADSIVLARSLAHKLCYANFGEIGEAIDEYIEARRRRMVRLSTQTYLIGQLLDNSSSLKKFFCTLLMVLLFFNRNGHTEYDCGSL